MTSINITIGANTAKFQEAITNLQQTVDQTAEKISDSFKSVGKAIEQTKAKWADWASVSTGLRNTGLRASRMRRRGLRRWSAGWRTRRSFARSCATRRRNPSHLSLAEVPPSLPVLCHTLFFARRETRAFRLQSSRRRSSCSAGTPIFSRQKSRMSRGSGAENVL